MRSNDSDLFAGLGPPCVPDCLKESTVMAGRQAMARAPQPDIWSKVWMSRTVRLAWMAGVVVLVASHLAIPFERAARPEGFAVPVRVASTHESDELAEIVDLPRINHELPSFVGWGAQPREETQS